MTAQTARLLVDGNGLIIPNQYYDAATNSFIAGSASNPLPVAKISDATATATTGNGTITTGGTSQVLLTAKTRKGYWVRNLSSGSLYINRSGGAATTSHFEIKSGDYFETPTWENVSTAIEIIGATTGQAFGYGECV